MNEYDVYESQCSGCTRAYDVPHLGVRLIGGGPLFQRVLHTLSSSPRFFALDPGSAPPVPSSWHRVSYGGISIAVPSNWKQTRRTSWNTCGLGGTPLLVSDAPANTIMLASGATVDVIETNCADGGPYTGQVTAPTNGVVIDPGPYGPLTNDPRRGPCLEVNGLTTCPSATDVYGVLTLAVKVPGKSQAVVVEIGLTGNRMMARTILLSIRAG